MPKEKDNVENQHHVGADDWKKEFNITAESLAERGDAIGFIRVVAFEKDDDVKVMSDLHSSPAFARAFIQMLVQNDKSFKYLKTIIDEAGRQHKLKDMDFGHLIDAFIGNRFPRGGPMSGMEAVRRFLCDDDEPVITSRRPGDLSSIIEMIGKNEREDGLKIHVVEVGGNGTKNFNK